MSSKSLNENLVVRIFLLTCWTMSFKKKDFLKFPYQIMLLVHKIYYTYTIQTEYFDIVAGVLQGDTLAPYLFIICLDYVLRTSIDKIRENGFELTKRRSKRYPAKTITDADYADDLALLANTPNHYYIVWKAAAGIGANKTCVTTKRQHCHTRRSLSETSRQIHLPRKQRYQPRRTYDWRRHTAIDNHMEVGPNR